MMFASASSALTVTAIAFAPVAGVPTATLVGLSEIESDATTPLNVIKTALPL